MKRILFILGIISAGTVLQAQAVFQNAISIPFITAPVPKSVVQTSDGGYLIASASTSANSSALMKTDANGVVTWTKFFTTGSYFNIIQAAECMGGGYYMFGESSDSSWTNAGFTLIKLDPTGNITWGKIYPVSVGGYGYSKIRQTTDGGFLISESLYSKMGALKLDVNGDIMWSKAFSDDANDQSPKCPSFDCCINNDGSMVFTGKRNSDVCLVKTDAYGSMAWSSVIGGGLTYYHAYGITATSDGGYVVCGYADYSPVILKVNAGGALLWYHVMYVSSGGEFDQVKELPNGNLIAVGSDSYAKTFVATFNTGGTILNCSTFGDYSTSGMSAPTMCLTSDGGFAIAGTYTNNTTGMTALTLMKTDANGNFPCTFVSTPMSANTSLATPTILNVPIYTFTEASSEVPATFQSTDMNVTQADFCTLFSTNDQVATLADISAFPSPVNSGENLHLTISGVDGSSVISIYDASGKVVKQFNQEFSGNQPATLEIPTNNLSAGIYLVRITGADQSVLANTKFIVK